MTNTDPETGIRYGIIAANSLHPEIVDEIQQHGVDLYHEARREEVRDAVRHAAKDYLEAQDVEDLANRAAEHLRDFVDDEPIHEFEFDGVVGRTTWLGGALMVWVFKSPFCSYYPVCSPCVPNAGNLDGERSPDSEARGVMTYDVPADWRYQG